MKTESLKKNKFRKIMMSCTYLIPTSTSYLYCNNHSTKSFTVFDSNILRLTRYSRFCTLNILLSTRNTDIVYDSGHRWSMAGCHAEMISRTDFRQTTVRSLDGTLQKNRE